MQTIKTKRAFLYAPGDMRIDEIELEMNDNQYAVKIASCGLCAWELNFWKGYLRTEGYPYTLGHEYGGTVVAVGKNVTKVKVGDKVTGLDGLQGFSEYAVFDEDSPYMFKLADSVDPKYAVSEPLKCIVTVLNSVEAKPADVGVIQGCGPMGQWCIQALSGGYLSELIAIDVDDKKLELAKQFGATHVINSKKEDAVKRVSEITNGRFADFVIEGTGVPALLNSAQDYIKTTGRGKLILMSSHEEICPEFDFRKAILRSLDIRVAHPRHAYNGPEDFRRAVELLNKGIFKVEPLISHEFKLSEIVKAFEALENRPEGYLKGIVCPD